MSFVNEISIFEPPQDTSKPVISDLSSSGAETPQSTASKTIGDIRVSPSLLIFENAYDGKCFKQQLVIQNCGTKVAFIRLLPSSSTAFKFAHFKDGCYLSPGLKIIRHVSYTYRSSFPVMQGFATIWVNEKSFDYQFFVTLSAAVISVEPEQLNFGRIDAVNVATTRTLFIKNTGFKGTQFAIDLGRNELEVIVDPMKGTIPAKSKIALEVEVVGAKPGEFVEEMWIKTSPPLRVVITGNFVEPKLMVGRFIGGLDFILVNFRNVYYGSQLAKPLLIKNRSSSNSMYYVMAEIKGETMSLEEARKVDDNYRQFIIRPEDGRVSAEKGSVVLFTFTPSYTPMKNESYAACFIKVIRLDCKDISHGALKEPKIEHVENMHNRNSSSSSGNVENVFSSDLSAHYSESDIVSDEDTQHLSFENYVRVCLHGEKEVASISFRPDSLFLSELVLFKVYERELLIRNQCSILPITVRYRKTASIDVIPNVFELPPKGELEVRIVIRTAKLGTISQLIAFDLFDRNLPVQDKNCRKVGSGDVPIEFSIQTVLIKERLKKCLKSAKCQDLKLKLPDQFPFKLQPLELAQKVLNDNYYLEYIQNNISNKERIKEFMASLEAQDYDLTNKLLVLHQQVNHHWKVDSRTKLQAKPLSKFIPLSPKQLFYVKVRPKSIRLRKVAAFTSTTEVFTIENQNHFPIRVILKPSKPCIHFFDNARHLVKEREKKTITFVFSSSCNGRYNINLDVIINESCVFQITIIAQVTPKALSLSTNDLNFKDHENSFAFISLLNALNAFTHFQWEIPEGCNFDVYPKQGVVPAERSLTCMVSLKLDPLLANISEICLVSEAGQTKMLDLSCKRKPLGGVIFNNYHIDCRKVPLNRCITKILVMKNTRKLILSYRVLNPEPIPGITIHPVEGRLDGKDSENFKISIQLNAVIEFKAQFIFIIDEREEYEITVGGIVEYPLISIKPNVLYFRKMAPNSFHTLVFKIKNLSKLDCDIKFELEDFPEFSVTESEFDRFSQKNNILLEPSEVKVLFLHCYPFHVSTYSFSLPFIINGILGPSVLVAATAAFLEQNEAIYLHLPDIEVIKKIPELLPTVRVNCCAIDKTLEFSSLNLNLVYYCENHYANVDNMDFTITNCGTETVKVCIRTDVLKPPFCLTPKAEDDCFEYYDVSYVIILEPGKKFTFEVLFEPYEYGEFTIRLPIFLRHYLDDKIFNYLTLTGVSDVPRMTPSQSQFYLEAVPLNMRNEIDFYFEMENHFEYCDVTARAEINHLYIICHTMNYNPCGKKRLAATLSFLPVKDICIDTKIEVTCTCNSSCLIYVKGIVETNLLVTHVFINTIKAEYGVDQLLALRNVEEEPEVEMSTTSIVPPRFIQSISNKNQTCFPFFPKPDDESVYAVHIRSVLKAVEHFLFSQVFQEKSYYKIPEGFTEFCITVHNNSGNVRNFELPLTRLILYLAGGKVKNQIITNECESEDDVSVMVYCFTIYSNVIKFLQKYMAFLPTVTPDILLNYQQYTLYHKIKGKKKDMQFEDEESFYLFSKQCWLELMLQILKIFILNTVDVKKKSLIKLDRPSLLSSSAMEEVQVSLYDFGIYGHPEEYLISWLEKNFNEQKDILWKDQQLENRQVNFFDEDLKSGLILGAVTAAYCPYATNYIEDMFTKPSSPEELFHNACKLVQTWKSLRFSYNILPQRIVAPNAVEMLLLVAYLHDVLPGCLPRETLEIETLLSKKRSVEIEVYNCGTSQSVYEPIFFGARCDLFEAEEPLLKVQPGKRKSLKIWYHAKSITRTSVHVLLSGENGTRFGKNIAVKLNGRTQVTNAFAEVSLKLPLYKLCQPTLEISSPFQMEAEYTINFVEGSPVDNEALIYTSEELQTVRNCSQCYLQYFTAHFDEKGKRVSTALMCLMKPKVQEFWIYYSNAEIGDFALKAECTPKITSDVYEEIHVTLPQKHYTARCTCKKAKKFFNENCPRVLNIKIPSTNNKLWNARKTMMLQTVNNEDELDFWTQKIFTPLGTRILTLILNSEVHPLANRVEESVTYTVLSEKDALFLTLNTFTIKNVISESFVDFPIHPTADLSNKTVNLRLMSADKEEKRYYRIIFSELKENTKSLAVNV